MVKRIEAVLTTKELLATDLYKVQFTVPEGLDFSPGQFMSIAVDGYIRRSYSFSNPPRQNMVLETYADVSPHGPAYKFFQNAEVGQTTNILAPLGKFTYQPDSRPAYFFATGTGIVPFLSMILHELEVAKSGREIHLYLGVRSEERLIWHEQLLGLEQSHANFHYHPYISQPVSGWSGRVGRITADIPAIMQTDVHAYICGGKVVIDDVEQLLLQQGIPANNIFYERYY